MNETPIFIAAGVGEGSRTVDGKHKPFLKIGNESNIQIVLNEVVKTKNTRPIYIWGSKEELHKELDSIIKRERDKREIHIIQQRGNIAENAIFAYFAHLRKKDRDFHELYSHVKDWRGLVREWRNLRAYYEEKNLLSDQADILLSDLPLVTSEEIDFLLKNKIPEVDLYSGWSLKEPFDEVMSQIDPHIDYSRIKMNFFPLVKKHNRRRKVFYCRFSGFFCAKYLNISSSVINVIPNLYKRRNLIEGKKSNFKRVGQIIREFISDLDRENLDSKVNKMQFMCHLSSLGTSGLISHFLHFNRWNRWLAHILSPFLEINKIQNNIKRLSGNDIRFLVSNTIGLLFDTDGDAYYFVKENYKKLRNSIYEYYSKKGMKLIHN